MFEWAEVLVDKKAEDMVEPCSGGNEPAPQGAMGYEFGDGEGEAVLLHLHLLHLHLWK